jgi:hypothetical protein
MPALCMAARAFEPLVVRAHVLSRTTVPGLRHGLEYLCDSWSLPWMQSPMELDLVSEMPGMVVAS